jgi:hypothetical protein
LFWQGVVRFLRKILLKMAKILSGATPLFSPLYIEGRLFSAEVYALFYSLGHCPQKGAFQYVKK